MEQSEADKEIGDFMAKRLIANTSDVVSDLLEETLKEDTHGSTSRGEGSAVSDPDDSVEETPTGLQINSKTEETDVTHPTTFTKVEKSLASLGFFTPSSKRLKDQKVKRITFTRELDGKRVEATAEIVPSAMFGLPVTADQDKYLALQQIITRILQRDGVVTNPIRFRSSDLLQILGRDATGGKNYREVSEWLDLMSSTKIFSNGVVYMAGQKRFAKDRFGVFERAVSVGSEMEDGSIADANYIWLSQWQLENINNNFVLPIDLETYRELKNHITKALVPALQTWLFASQKSGSFEKRYSELCEYLGVREYTTPSAITRQFKPSLDELIKYEYLAKWQIEKTSDQKAFKIVFFHGAKFHRDRRKRLEQKQNATEPLVIAESDPVEIVPIPGKLEAREEATQPKPTRRRKPIASSDSLPQATTETKSDVAMPAEIRAALEELSSRGVMQTVAIDLLWKLPPERRASIGDYVDYWDSIPPDPTRGKGAGLLLHLIETGDPLPPTFETRRKRQQRLANEKRAETMRVLKETLETEYDEYRHSTVEQFINDILSPAEFERRVVAWVADRDRQGDLWTPNSNRPDLIHSLAVRSVRAEVAKEVPMLSFEDFRRRELPKLVRDLGIDPAEFGLDLTTAPNAPDRSPSDVPTKDGSDRPDPSKSLP